jgi:hypothetical protein
MQKNGQCHHSIRAGPPIVASFATQWNNRLAQRRRSWQQPDSSPSCQAAAGIGIVIISCWGWMCDPLTTKFVRSDRQFVQRKCILAIG